MLGRMKLSLPVCSLSSAPPCAAFDPYIELINAMSSTQVDTCGNKLLTGMPHWPRGVNSQCDLSRFCVVENWTRGLAKGSGLPWSRVSSGFSSNVSTCDGPPCMNRKITRLALGSKCGRLGASGSGFTWANPDSASSDSSARLPKPAADRRSISRRLIDPLLEKSFIS